NVKKVKSNNEKFNYNELSYKELYTYCASCVSNFRRKGFGDSYHILSVILDVDENVPLGIKSVINRAKKKFI
ncbi:MAG: hypothetical protein LBR30_03465, partial [Clostridioides sp.]|nr:hypothetical protein [Clostridioides sp.]